MTSEFLGWFPAGTAIAYVAWMTAGVARRKKTVDWRSVRSPWTTYALFALLFGNLLASGLEGWARGGIPLPLPAWAGAGLIAAKGILTVWSIRTLGAAYSYHLGGSAEGGLVTTGPYAWCRHPLYAARLFATAGIPLAFGAWACLAAFLAADLLIIGFRIRSEEDVLEGKFGAAYAEYRRRVPSLLPLPPILSRDRT